MLSCNLIFTWTPRRTIFRLFRETNHLFILSAFCNSEAAGAILSELRSCRPVVISPITLRRNDTETQNKTKTNNKQKNTQWNTFCHNLRDQTLRGCVWLRLWNTEGLFCWLSVQDCVTLFAIIPAKADSDCDFCVAAFLRFICHICKDSNLYLQTNGFINQFSWLTMWWL